MEKDKVSVVVPIYNVENYLEECIESILNQTYSNIEVILIDDGSTDGSGALCDEYKKKDKRIYVLHKKNGGLSDARNMGIDNAKGEYITFVDSDDIIARDMIEYLLCLLNTYKADMAVCQCDYVDENSKLIKNISNVKKTCVSGIEECLKTLLVDSGLNTVAWGKIYKTDYFKNVRYPIGKYHEDIYTTWFTNWSGDESILERFDKLPFKNKIIFVNKNYTEYKSSIYLPGFEKKSGVGQIWKTKNIVGKRYIDQFDFVEYLNNV